MALTQLCRPPSEEEQGLRFVHMDFSFFDGAEIGDPVLYFDE
jgi:hypothetical protein